MNNHGTRAVQTLIECIRSNPTQVKQLVSALEKAGIIPITLDAHGNHVIQTCLLSFDPALNQPIFDCTMKQSLKISKDKHGCCVLQRFLEKGNSHQQTSLSQNIIKNLDVLISDPFGNYLVQNVIKLRRYDLNTQIITFIKSKIIRLSKQKFSSNVIEKCFEYTDHQTRQFMVEGLDLKKVVKELIGDSYGNYVIQRMLKYNKNNYQQIINEIGANISTLNGSVTGRKILSNLIKNHPDLNESGDDVHYPKKTTYVQHRKRMM